MQLILFILVLFKLKLQQTSDIKFFDQSNPAPSDANLVDLLLHDSEKFSDKES